LQKFYYEDGKIKIQANYKNDMLDGEYEEFDIDGNLKIQKLMSNGRIIRDGKEINNLKEGIHKSYYSSGNLETELNFKNGTLDGLQTFYYENGNIMCTANFNTGLLNGIFKDYLPDGTLYSEINYENGLKKGMEKEYYPSGKIYGEYINEDEDIKIQYSYNDGKKIIASSEKNGRINNTYENGSILSEENWKYGYLHGSYKEISTYGKILIEGRFSYGKKSGTFKYYYESGKIFKTVKFDNAGYEKQQQVYSENGEKIKFSKEKLDLLLENNYYNLSDNSIKIDGTLLININEQNKFLKPVNEEKLKRLLEKNKKFIIEMDQYKNAIHTETENFINIEKIDTINNDNIKSEELIKEITPEKYDPIENY
ncbi:MAG: hypothetical protein LBT51_06855, partial [Fusobacteriaceae bacterium]|nr:hypothetical protein [Fusobacteriaceae bacterium]